MKDKVDKEVHGGIVRFDLKIVIQGYKIRGSILRG